MKFRVGHYVYKQTGYLFCGYVIMSGWNRRGEERFVVENGDGLCHIFNGEQLELAPRVGSTLNEKAIAIANDWFTVAEEHRTKPRLIHHLTQWLQQRLI